MLATDYLAYRVPEILRSKAQKISNGSATARISKSNSGNDSRVTIEIEVYCESDILLERGSLSFQILADEKLQITKRAGRAGTWFRRENWTNRILETETVEISSRQPTNEQPGVSLNNRKGLSGPFLTYELFPSREVERTGLCLHFFLFQEYPPQAGRGRIQRIVANL